MPQVLNGNADSATRQLLKPPRTAIAVVALTVALALTGCSAKAIPVLSTPDRLSTKPPAQLLKETIRQVNDLARYLGGKWESGPDLLWDPNDTSRWRRGSCGTGTNAFQYSVNIQDLSAVADPTAEIAKVRAYWKKLGYHEISQIGPQPKDDQKYTQIGVYLPGKAGLQFSASTTQRSISVQSECGKLNGNADSAARYLPPRTAIAMVALAVALALTGCSANGIPVLSTPDRLSTKPPAQLLKETMRQVNDLAVYLGGKWNALGSPDRPWNPNDTTGWGPGSCGTGTSASQFSVDVQDVSVVADPDAEIAKVRAYWKKLGYHEISQIGPQPKDDQKYTQIGVYLPGKAGLQFSASTWQRSISVQSECRKF